MGHMSLLTGQPTQQTPNIASVLATRYPTADTSSQKYDPPKPKPAPPKKPIAVSATAKQPKGNCEAWMIAAGIPLTTATNKLIVNESGCNPRAINPSSGACGIPQAYPCSKLPNGVNTDPVAQLKWMDSYIKSRYGSWERALSFWYAQCPTRLGCHY